MYKEQLTLDNEIPMKKFIRTLSTSLAILTGLSTCILSVNAAKDSNVSIRGTGYIQDTDAPVSDTSSNISSSSHTLPKSVDISKSDSFPCVRDQGQYNSCASWATTYYQFGYEVAAMNGWNGFMSIPWTQKVELFLKLPEPHLQPVVVSCN